jgi:prepilin-type N-terminal cleavage/methylation domain-containing protein
MVSMIKNKFRSAFTIVELIVVIAVIGILAGIVLMSYGSWRTSVATSSLKSDLVHAASAMESNRTFSNSYSTTIPTTFTASSGNTINVTTDTKSFCLDGTSTNSASIQYYIDNLTQTTGATSGTCIGRTSLPIPTIVTNVTFTTGTTTIVVSWTLASPNNYATQYLVQCSVDPGFISGLIQQTNSSGTATTQTLTGANSSSTYYCRVRAINNNGQSDWSSSSASDTQQKTCASTSQYGSYPSCYNYDSLPPGTSIAGYWTTPPDGYLLEDGSAVSRSTYADLYAVVGTGYGSGDGSSTYNVPDSRGRVTVNLSASDAEFNSMGEKYGEKTHTLSLAEMPSHNHQQYVTANSGGTGVRSDYVRDGGGGSYYQGVGTATTGSSAAYNVIQPSMVKQFAIKYRVATGTTSTIVAGTTLQGYWPSAPTGYQVEDGSAVSRTSYASLFANIGTTYGAGDGSTTFNLPDSRGRVGVNKNSSDTQFATLGLRFGEKTHLLTIAELVSHNHAEIITAATSAGPGIRTDYSADAPGAYPYDQGAQTGPMGSSQAHNVIQPSIVKLSVIKTAAASGSSDDVGMQTGSTIEGWWPSVPSGYLIEDGSGISRTTFATLFSVIGTVYGAGDGSTTFNLPDSRGRVAVNLSATDSQFSAIGQKYGEKTHTMTLAELPTHYHDQYVTANSGSSYRIDYHADASSVTYSQGINTGSTGGSTAFNMIQPSITKYFAIKY